MVEVVDKENMSLSDMLKVVRNMMADDNVKNKNEEDVLELSEDVLELNEETEVKSETKDSDILDTIDKVIGTNEEVTKTEEVPQANINKDEMDALFDAAPPANATDSNINKNEMDALFDNIEQKVEINEEPGESLVMEMGKMKAVVTETPKIEEAAKLEENINPKPFENIVQEEIKSKNPAPAFIEEKTEIVEEVILDQAKAMKVSERARLLSPTVAKESTKVLKNLLKTVDKPSTDSIAFRNSSTLEDLVIETMKPYLSEWLDHNLPKIVKRIVEREVRKLIPKDYDDE